MAKTFMTAASAIVLSIVMVSFSFAGASCCDPAKVTGIQGASPAQVGATKSVTPAVPNNPASQSIAAFMGYGKPEGVRLSDLAPRGGCCPNPNASCGVEPNPPGQQWIQNFAPSCAAGCCGAKKGGAQPGQSVGQVRGRPIQAVGPALTVSPVKAVARPRPSGFGGLW